MRLFIKLKFDRLTLPVYYNHIQQALVYNWINDTNYQSFLHDRGFTTDKSAFKMFTFSKFYGNYEYNNESKSITFKNHVWFTLSSHDDKFLEYIIDKILFTEHYSLLDQEVRVSNIKYDKFSPNGGLKVITKSPITAHVSFKIGNKTKTHYLSPFEEEFNNNIRINLIKKYKAFYGVEPEDNNFFITPINNNVRMVISFYVI
jgi:CRISPR-associated endoribonuclease Cas6